MMMKIVTAVRQIQAISQHGNSKLKGERASVDIDTHGIFTGQFLITTWQSIAQNLIERCACHWNFISY